MGQIKYFEGDGNILYYDLVLVSWVYMTQKFLKCRL